MNILQVKLVTNHLVIAQLLEEHREYFKVKYARLVVYSNSSLIIEPYSYLHPDDEMLFYKKNIICRFATDSSGISEYYLEHLDMTPKERERDGNVITMFPEKED